MLTALFCNVLSQLSLPESWAFCPKNPTSFVAGGGAAPIVPLPRLLRLWKQKEPFKFSEMQMSSIVFYNPATTATHTGFESTINNNTNLHINLTYSKSYLKLN